jgi:enoyl-[acyl-carrier protein] reductase I
MSVNASRTASPSSPKNSTASWFDCDVGSDEQINALFADLGKSWSQLDGLVHAIGFARRSHRRRLPGRFLARRFPIAHDISAYSFPAMAKAAMPLLPTPPC